MTIFDHFGGNATKWWHKTLCRLSTVFIPLAAQGAYQSHWGKRHQVVA